MKPSTTINTNPRWFKHGRVRDSSPLRQIWWYPVFLVLFIPPFILPFLIPSHQNLISWIVAVLYPSFIVYVLFLKVLEWKYRMLAKKLCKNREQLIAITNDQDGLSIEEVLLLTETLHQRISIVVYYKKSMWLLYNESARSILIELSSFTITWASPLLSSLRSTLSTRLSEQQSRLIEARGEVEKLQKTPLPPLTGGFETSLDSVSEAQIARLDRQIEQFEELQKRLVRV